MSLDGSVVVQFPSGFAATAFVSKSGLSWTIEITNTTPAALSGTIVTQWRLPETSRARTYIVTFVDQLALQFEPERVVLADDRPSNRPEEFVALWFGETTAVALAPAPSTHPAMYTARAFTYVDSIPRNDLDCSSFVRPANRSLSHVSLGWVAFGSSSANHFHTAGSGAGRGRETTSPAGLTRSRLPNLIV
jgi:hypothetical protein